MVSFLANPERTVKAPDGTDWHVALVRGNKWNGVDWDRHPTVPRHPFDRPLLNALVEGYLFDGLLWLIYRAQGRNDWRVVLRTSPHLPLTAAVLDERYEGQDKAAARAADLLKVVRARGFPVAG